MATAGPALELARLAPERAVVVDTALGLANGLAERRPCLVVLAAPPAGREEMALVADERRRRRTMRAVLINEAAAADERLRALSIGFDEALPASLSGAELAGRARLLAARQERTASVVAIDATTELDLVAHELRRDGVAVHLRPKELRLLTLLVRNPGRAFTRRQLLDRVWGQGVDSDPRTVDVHVRWLRSKVERDPERPSHLVTVRGVGYRLDLPER